MLNTHAANDVPIYHAQMTANSIKWKNGKHPPSIASHTDAMRALKTIFLSSYELHQRNQESKEPPLTNSDPPPTTDPRGIEPADALDCGEAKTTGWLEEPDKLRATRLKFKQAYVFNLQMGDVFLGTDQIDLLGFDGMINLQVVGTTMSLVMHSSCKDKTSADCQSNVEHHIDAIDAETGQPIPHECTGVNMLALKFKVNKLGIAHPGLSKSLPYYVPFDFYDGVHLSELPLFFSKFLPSNHEYELHVRIGLSASATLDPLTKQWHMSKDDVHLCSPGIELGGEIAEGRFVSWLAGLIKGIVSNNLLVPVYCAMKYTLPTVPWLGPVLNFVASDEARKRQQQQHSAEEPFSTTGKNGDDEEEDRDFSEDVLNKLADSSISIEDEEDNVFQLSLDNKIDPDSSSETTVYDLLHFRTGWQLNVPTLRFIG